jgi:hypothetical protein
MNLVLVLAQGYESKPVGERIGYIAGVLLVVVLVVWVAVAIIRRIRGG